MRITAGVFGLLSLIHLLIPIANHYFFRTFAADYAFYNYAFYDFAHFRLTPCPAYPIWFPVHFLQDHMSFLLVFLSPLYWIMKDVTGTYSLLVLQFIFVISGGYYTIKLITYKTNDERLGLLAMILYFVLYGRYSAYQSDCNLVIMGSAVVPVFFYYFERGKLLAATFCFFLCMISREDFPLWFIFICSTLIIIHWKNRRLRLYASLLLVFSLIYFIVLFKYIIPSFEDEFNKFSLFRYSVLGATPAEALKHLASHPLDAIRLLFVNHSGDPANDHVKMSLYLIYGISGGLILFYRPVYIICLIPLIAKKMFYDEPLRWGSELHFAIEICSILPVLVFYVIKDLNQKRTQLIVAGSICLLALCTTFYVASDADNKKYNFLNKKFYKSELGKDGHKIVSLIPDDAAISASIRILPHLAFRDKMYYFITVKDAEYVCVKKTKDSWPAPQEQFDEELEKLKNSKEWLIVKETAEVILLKKK